MVRKVKASRKLLGLVKNKLSELIAGRDVHERQDFMSSDDLRNVASDSSVVVTKRKARKVYGFCDSKFTTNYASKYNLDKVIEVVKKAKIRYFLVPGISGSRYRVGIESPYRNAFLRELFSSCDGTGLYIARPSRGGQIGTDDISLVLRSLQVEQYDDNTIVRIGQFFVAPSGRMLAREQYWCDVEFWDKVDSLSDKELGGIGLLSGADVTGSLFAHNNNRVSRLVPRDYQQVVTKKIGNSTYKTLAVFDQKLVDDIIFPIDIVYTWVDGSDPKWLKDHLYWRKKLGISGGNNTASRYTDHDELKYSLRSVNMFAPWVRNIYIVTDNQTPKWLDVGKSDKIHLISHKDIFTDKTVLPVYNSHAINTQLHHIKGLSENYIIFNDDVFLGKPSLPEAFFTSNGLMKVALSKYQFGIGEPGKYDVAPSASGKNIRALLKADFGVYIANKLKHIPITQLRSVAYELEDKYTADVERTSASKFRSTSDIEFAGTLLSYYAAITARAIYCDHENNTIDISSPEASEELAQLRKDGGTEVFCLNDSDTPDGQKELVRSMIVSFLDDYYPFSAPWEKY